MTLTSMDYFVLNRVVEHANKHSKDPSTKVGAALIHRSGDMAFFTHNQLPVGTPEETWQDRESKLRLVIHAETAALLGAPFDPSGATIFVNRPPCERCASLLVQAGVGRVICLPWPEGREDQHPEAERGRQVLERGGAAYVCVEAE